MSEPFYVVKHDLPNGGYIKPDIFQDKNDAIVFAGMLDALRYPGEDPCIHLYEVKEIDFTR